MSSIVSRVPNKSVEDLCPADLDDTVALDENLTQYDEERLESLGAYAGAMSKPITESHSLGTGCFGIIKNLSVSNIHSSDDDKMKQFLSKDFSLFYGNKSKMMSAKGNKNAAVRTQDASALSPKSDCDTRVEKANLSPRLTLTSVSSNEPDDEVSIRRFNDYSLDRAESSTSRNKDDSGHMSLLEEAESLLSMTAADLNTNEGEKVTSEALTEPDMMALCDENEDKETAELLKLAPVAPSSDPQEELDGEDTGIDLDDIPDLSLDRTEEETITAVGQTSKRGIRQSFFV